MILFRVLSIPLLAMALAHGAHAAPQQANGNGSDELDKMLVERGLISQISQVGQTIGLILPRTANQQAAATVEIDKSELQPGDLVFFNTLRRAFSHVGIYVGDNKFIHSPKPGSEVRVEDMNIGYWRTRFNGARRVETAAIRP